MIPGSLSSSKAKFPVQQMGINIVQWTTKVRHFFKCFFDHVFVIPVMPNSDSPGSSATCPYCLDGSDLVGAFIWITPNTCPRECRFPDGKYTDPPPDFLTRVTRNRWSRFDREFAYRDSFVQRFYTPKISDEWNPDASQNADCIGNWKWESPDITYPLHFCGSLPLGGLP